MNPGNQKTVVPAAAAPLKAPPAPVGGELPAKPAIGAEAKKNTNPNSTQNALQIAEIRDGIVIMNDGSFRSVVMVKSINFDLMSPEEQEAIEFSYQGFLNSLYFPVQIFMRSQKIDLKPYIEKLVKIKSQHENMLLTVLMDDYIGYIDGLSQDANIMDKKFYIAIPYYPVLGTEQVLTQSKNFLSGLGKIFNKKDQHIVINEKDLESAKTELRNRVQAVMSGLQQSSIQSLPLDTKELIELYYDSYNPDTATRQPLKDFNELDADIVKKGQGMARKDNLSEELN